MKKGLPVRLLALLLCCFCLLSAIPTQALATDDVTPPVQEEVTPEPKTDEPQTGEPQTEEPKTGEPQTEEPQTEEPTLSLYDRLMACQSVEEINAILDNLTEEENEELDAFTDEQNAALEAHVAALGGYDTSVMREYYVSAKPGEEVTVDVDRLYAWSTECKCPSENGIEASYEDGKVTITVGNTVKAGQYTVYVQTSSYYNWEAKEWVYETKHTIVVTVSADGTAEDESRQPNTDLKYYNGNNTVTYDVVNAGQAMDDSSHTYISSVTLNGKAVAQANADWHYGIQAYKSSSCTTGNGWYADAQSMTISKYNPNYPDAQWTDYGYYNQTGEKLSKYYTSGTSANEQSVTLEITPADGYYVTRVYITCSNGKTPLNCEVLKKNKAYDEPFTLETGLKVSVPLSNKWFGHYSYFSTIPSLSNYMSLSGLYQYFLLIEVARIPTPTFVEYDYGDIVTHGGSTNIFDDPDGWVTASSSNAYGTTNTPDTQDTQFRYTYSENNPGESTNWKHYANTVTDAAKNNAASVGYYFAGWKAVYYTECDVSDSGAIHGNNKLYTFSNPAYNGREFEYKGGDQVSLYTHVKLVAQWKPIQVKVTKEVTGLYAAGYGTKPQSYTLKLQKVSDDGTATDIKEVAYAITGDGELSYTFGGEEENPVVITPGTYKVVETGDYTIKGNTYNAVCATTYAPQTVEVTADGTVKELKVINTYTQKAATKTLTITKRVTGNAFDETKTFPFTIICNQDMTCGEQTSKTITVDMKKDQSIQITVPVGATVTVTEDPGTYVYSYVEDESDVTVTKHETNPKGVTFTMPDKDCKVTFKNTKDVVIETGVELDFLPFALMLALAMGGVLLTFKRRRSV